MPAPRTPRTKRRIPSATYRVQFNRDFTLRQGLELVPYLSELGISHLYASPLLKATPGSAHGYDVCDFESLNPELGTEEDFRTLVTALHARGMGLVLDIVPNHAGIASPENRWWQDVLKKGRASRFARYFDIDWNSSDPGLKDKVLAPVLGDRYQRVLERKELRLELDGKEIILRYGEHRFPFAAETRAAISQRMAGRGETSEAVAGTLAELNADAGELDRLIQQQHYVPTSWRHSHTTLNYRRFFAVDSLASLRAEDARVFAASHSLIRRWLEEGLVDGLRVDHPDGLSDPEQYLRRLRKIAPRAWIIVEKILASEESLRVSWPVEGETGYAFLNKAGGLLVDPAGEEPFNRIYSEFTGQSTDYPAVVHEKKRGALRELLGPEMERLAGLLRRICLRHWRYRDFFQEELREALMELAACFPVYRSYLRPRTGKVSPTDAAWVRAALADARKRRELDPAALDFLGALLLLEIRGGLETEFVLRFQQLTAPAMAKGVEDNAFYCFNRLVSLNEVGGDPGQFGFSTGAFHRACAGAATQFPASMLASSTHDTKRGEDVRARLALLSEIPEQWGDTVRRWAAINEHHRRNGLFDRNTEYYLYQILAGAWPIEVDRVLSAMEKAACEANTHTSWLCRNHAYEEAMRGFVTGALQDRTFVEDLERFVALLTEPGWMNSLAQTLIKLTAPGVPDIYQGAELWEFSLVDPDNRRPVDFERRRRLLSELPGLTAETAWQRRDDGVAKLWLIQKVLGLRRRVPALYDGSSYRALAASGGQAGRLVAFLRGDAAVTVTPRLVMGLAGGWEDTVLEVPKGEWRNMLTDDPVSGGAVSLAQLLAKFPVALLTRQELG